MRLSILLKFAKLLMISRLRSTKHSFVSGSITERPLLIGLIGTGLFIAGLLAGVATGLLLGIEEVSLVETSQLLSTVLGGIPLFLIGFNFIMGLLWELNASAEVESTDAVNWLPISPTQYVAASSISTSYTYSPALMGALGYALPLTILTGKLHVFLLLIPLGSLASLIGSVGVEILRSALARASTAFNRLGGRTMVLLRILAIMLILVLTQIFFSGFFVFQVIGSLVEGATVSFLVPVFWPTLSLIRALRADLVGSAGFLSLSAGFVIFLLWTALYLRAKYWVVSPVPAHFSRSGAVSGPSRLNVLGLSPKFLALLEREFRSATRRREMVRLIAIPIVIPLMIAFPTILSLGRPGPEQVDPIFLAGPFLFGVGIGALFLGMTSIGQEGKSIWNLSALPVTAPMLVEIKFLFTAAISLMGLGLGTVVTTLLFNLSFYRIFAFLVIGVALILAEANLGVAIASRYPDFSEGPRPRFVTILGSIIGALIGIAEMLVMAAPLGIMLVLRFYLGIPITVPGVLATSSALGLLLAWAGYRLALGHVQQILEELPA